MHFKTVGTVVYVVISWLVIYLLAIMAMYALSAILNLIHIRKQRRLDYIVVLGCQVKGTKPSKALKDRLDTAKEYMQANPETIAVLSGGQGKMEEISEAECMRRYLEKAGISRERLILEQRSTTTRQNLRYSRRYMDYRHDEIGIITNNFHVYRSVLLARRSGYQRVCGIAAPCKSVLLYHYLVREAFALAREMLHKR